MSLELWRDRVLAGRSLAKARAFTFVCVVSLGIGMAPVIAIPYASRLSRMPPAGVNTEGLVELVTTPMGPRQANRNSVNGFLKGSAIAGGAGSVILMPAALGIYGVVGLMVAARSREIAVRAALGASRRRLLGMIVFDVVKLVTPGVVLGMVLTAVLNRLNSHNMGIALSNLEPLAYIVGAAIAVLVAVLASLPPARRAASVQPMVAMRSE
jgi:hypothetical protein